MLRRAPLLMLVSLPLALSAALPGAQVDAGDPRNEPPIRLELKIDGRSIEMVSDVPKQVEIDGKLHSVTIHPLATRRFDIGRLAFEYPSSMAFEYEKDGTGETWSFHGSHVVIMVMRGPRSEAGFDADDILEEVAETIGVDPQETQACELRVGSELREGTAARFQIAGVVMYYEYYILSAPEGDEYVLMLSESSDDARRTREFRHVKELLGQSALIR